MPTLSQGGVAPTVEERIALVAESDGAVGSLIRTLLVRAGFYVLTAPTGRDALRMCRASGLSIEVAVLEVELPDMPGAELMRHLRALHPEVGIVFIGADAQDERLRGFPPGPLVTKPFHPEELLRLIRGVGIGRLSQTNSPGGQHGRDDVGGRA